MSRPSSAPTMNAHRGSVLEIAMGYLGGRSSGVEGRISGGEAGEVAERVETEYGSERE